MQVGVVRQYKAGVQDGAGTLDEHAASWCCCYMTAAVACAALAVYCLFVDAGASVSQQHCWWGRRYAGCLGCGMRGAAEHRAAGSSWHCTCRQSPAQEQVRAQATAWTAAAAGKGMPWSEGKGPHTAPFPDKGTQCDAVRRPCHQHSASHGLA